MKNKITVYVLISFLFLISFLLYANLRNLRIDYKLLEQRVAIIESGQIFRFDNEFIFPDEPPAKGQIPYLVPGTNRIEWVEPEF